MCAYNDADDEDDENDDDDDDNDEGGVVTTARRPATLLQRGVQRYCPCRMTGCARAFAAHPGPLKEPLLPLPDNAMCGGLGPRTAGLVGSHPHDQQTQQQS